MVNHRWNIRWCCEQNEILSNTRVNPSVAMMYFLDYIKIHSSSVNSDISCCHFIDWNKVRDVKWSSKNWTLNFTFKLELGTVTFDICFQLELSRLSDLRSAWPSTYATEAQFICSLPATTATPLLLDSLSVWPPTPSLIIWSCRSISSFPCSCSNCWRSPLLILIKHCSEVN